MARPIRETLHTAEKNPVGRPKNGEYAAKPVVVHKKNKPENTVKYSVQAVRNAQSIYKKFALGYPNPLNIDEKDLDEAARETWKCIYGSREYDESAVANQRERIFYNTDEMLFAFECYCNYIKIATL